MKILWLTNTHSCYIPKKDTHSSSYNGGGWIASAESNIREDSNIQLAVSFMLDGESWKVIQNGVTYYPIPHPEKNIFQKIRRKIISLFSKQLYKSEEKLWKYFLNRYNKIIADFKPDIIQVWGTEGYGGLIYQITNTPIVVHIQGLINPCFNAFLPPSVSWHNYKWQTLSPFKWLENQTTYNRWKINCYREQIILKNTKYYMGRTVWDKRIIHLYNQNSKYYHVNEILRDIFYFPSERNNPHKLTIVTTISQPMYKGFDLILKTASILKNYLNLDFDWYCLGNINSSYIEHKLGLFHNDLNVHLNGVASPDELKKIELNSTLYFHSSYIDNSPNSICEAQMLGCPIISTNVGGISTLVEDGFTGFLIPGNDPYQGAYLIKKLFLDKKLNQQISENCKKVALQRHNIESVINQIKLTYKDITNNNVNT